MSGLREMLKKRNVQASFAPRMRVLRAFSVGTWGWEMALEDCRRARRWKSWYGLLLLPGKRYICILRCTTHMHHSHSDQVARFIPTRICPRPPRLARK